MGPQGVSCPNPARADRGAAGKGDVRIHSLKERRSRRATREKTFAASKGTPFYRPHEDDAPLAIVVTLLAHGRPLPAAVAAYGLDGRAVADWRDKAGERRQAVRQRHLEAEPLDLGHVQADEPRANRQGGRSGVARAGAAPSRPWRGGVLSPVRAMAVVEKWAALVRLAWLPGTTPLARVDGLASYVSASWRASREKAMTGRRGRPPYRMPGVAWLARVVKERARRALPEGGGEARGLGGASARARAAGEDEDGGADQRVVHREAERDVPGLPGGADEARPEAGEGRRRLGEGHAPGGPRLQLLQRAPRPPRRAAEGQEAA